MIGGALPKKTDDRGDKDRSEIYVMSIQVLFSIIIGVSFLDYRTTLVPPAPNFETFTILAAYSTVLASLVGYSIAIKKQFHRNVRRFVLDVILLYLYYQLVYSPQKDFTYFLSVLPWIFGIYIFWQYLEHREWGNSFRKKFKVSFTIFVIFLGMWIYEAFFNTDTIIVDNNINSLHYQNVTYVEWIILGGVFVLVLGFRYLLSLITRHRAKPNTADKLS